MNSIMIERFAGLSYPVEEAINTLCTNLSFSGENVKKIMPILPKKRIKEDIHTIYETIRQIAYREEVTTDIRYMSIGEYAEYMKGPHRMDLMVSAMTRKGAWHCNQKCIHCYAADQSLAEVPSRFMVARARSLLKTFSAFGAATTRSSGHSAVNRGAAPMWS